MFDYRKLPDGMWYDDWRRCFIEFLFDYQNVMEENRYYAFEQLYAITERETYEVLDEPVRNAISDFIVNNVDYENLDMMELVVQIVPILGLEKAWDVIWKKKDMINNIQVVRLIEEEDEECRKFIKDPLIGYKNLEKPNPPVKNKKKRLFWKRI